MDSARRVSRLLDSDAEADQARRNRRATPSDRAWAAQAGTEAGATPARSTKAASTSTKAASTKTGSAKTGSAAAAPVNELGVRDAARRGLRRRVGARSTRQTDR